ncbi:hypothetical protein H6G80_31315 [Nostoc sp. FACHB-87]|uniref:hypothetical protein n=1 Tax=Nostocales TaxID=1161 RepID=UPI001687B544|nr:MULTISPECIES: hypothetical protein [Nostocales]MBD2302597.1 hypothetical protein [Nostoc sp. FACHB-190]MBD2458543.1 hypothetical protein [Nostoc sp. FACHB-87]MBD2479623.1 hypothetical protein [Anabaena sp. FACHB-83]MBD2492204.1 hypothetical protein [Aulosira sp. FACHB-615]
MNQSWREALFNQENTDSALNPLVLPMTNAKSLRILGICYRTWGRWEEVAETIAQYKLAQIQMKNFAEQYSLRASPILPYQVWVVGKVGEIFDGLAQGTNKLNLAKAIVATNKAQYSRKEFEVEQIRFTKPLTGDLQNV